MAMAGRRIWASDLPAKRADFVTEAWAGAERQEIKKPISLNEMCGSDHRREQDTTKYIADNARGNRLQMSDITTNCLPILIKPIVRRDAQRSETNVRAVKTQATRR
jgi:hypothetical protein